MDNFKSKIIIGVASAIFLGALCVGFGLSVKKGLDKLEAKITKANDEVLNHVDIQRLLNRR